MNSSHLVKELERLYLTKKAGLISASQARDNLALIRTMLQAEGQVELERKLEAISAILQKRR